MDLDESNRIVDDLVGRWLNEAKAAKDVDHLNYDSIPAFIRVVSHLALDRKFLGRAYAIWLAAKFLTKHKYVPLDSLIGDRGLASSIPI